jgi:hypothetical protein
MAAARRQKVKVRVAIASVAIEGQSYVQGAVLELAAAEADALLAQGAVEKVEPRK